MKAKEGRKARVGGCFDERWSSIDRKSKSGFGMGLFEIDHRSRRYEGVDDDSKTHQYVYSSDEDDQYVYSTIGTSM